MRILFSIAGLLVVLAIIGVTARHQLRSLAPEPAAQATTPADDDAPAPLSTGTPQQQVQKMQTEVERALAQGAARAPEVAP